MNAASLDCPRRRAARNERIASRRIAVARSIPDYEYDDAGRQIAVTYPAGENEAYHKFGTGMAKAEKDRRQSRSRTRTAVAMAQARFEINRALAGHDRAALPGPLVPPEKTVDKIKTLDAGLSGHFLDFPPAGDSVRPWIDEIPAILVHSVNLAHLTFPAVFTVSTSPYDPGQWYPSWKESDLNTSFNPDTFIHTNIDPETALCDDLVTRLIRQPPVRWSSEC